jgi:hypothetical protein
MSDDAWAVTKIFIGSFGFVFGVAWLAASLAVAAAKYKCQAYGELTGHEVKVIAGYTCMINDPDKGWMSYEERVGRRIN